jgi:hypothetical protein
MPFSLWELDRVRTFASPRTAVACNITRCLCNRLVLRNKSVKELRIFPAFDRYETQTSVYRKWGALVAQRHR